MKHFSALWFVLVTISAVEADLSSAENNTYITASEPPTNQQQQCSQFRESHISPQDAYHGNLERVRILDHGWINGSVNFTMSPTSQSWRLICPQQNYVAIVVLQLNLSDHYFLNVKHIQFTGCTDSPRSYIFNKKSIMVGIVANHNASTALPNLQDWNMGYICIRHSMSRFAKHLLLYDKTMLYIKNHPGSYSKIARLLSHPQTILEAGHDEELQHILNLARENEKQQLVQNNTYSGSGSEA